eukprot:771648-Alexandrium_andersonii.AAC.1
MGGAQHDRHGGHRQQPHLHAPGIDACTSGAHAYGIGTVAATCPIPGNRGTTAASAHAHHDPGIGHEVRVAGN